MIAVALVLLWILVNIGLLLLLVNLLRERRTTDSPKDNSPADVRDRRSAGAEVDSRTLPARGTEPEDGW